MGAGKSTALSALRALGAEVISSDAVVHELYEGEELRGRARASASAPRSRPAGAVDRAALARRAFADRRGPRLARGPGVAAGRRADRCLAGACALAATRRRGPRWSRCRCCSRRGCEGIYDATIAVVADEALRRSRAAARGHVLLDERDARQLTQQEKARPRDLRGAQRRHGAGSGRASCRRCLTS